MKKAVLFLMAVSALLSCSKTDSTEELEKINPGEETISIADLVKHYDIAAIVNWTYANDAEIDHALFTNTDAQYSRDEVTFTINTKSGKKISDATAFGAISATLSSAYNRVTRKFEVPTGVTLHIRLSGDKATTSIQGLKWDMNYYFTVYYGKKTISGIIATVDRNRDIIEIELPEWVVKLNDKDSGYDKGNDTYTSSKQDFSDAFFNSFVANRIINTDPGHPDYENAAAFLAKEGKIQEYAQEGDTDLISFSDGTAATKIKPSSKLKETLESGNSLVRHVATYCGQVVKITQPLSVDYPGYDFLHLSYYTFNTETSYSQNNFIQKYGFDDNDGSVKWWTKVFPSYFTTIGTSQDRISNRRALAQFDISYINLAELAFNVVDEQDRIMDEEEISAANLSIRFSYTDKDLGEQPLPAVDATSKYKTYQDLWVDKTVFYYRTCEKDFIPVRGTIAIKSGDAEFEIPTRFDRPKASVKYPDVTLDYSTFAIVQWQPFKIPTDPGFEITLDEHKTYRVPMLQELMDNRPNNVSYNVIQNGAWVVGNVLPADAGSNPSYGNGYIKGIKACDAYEIDPNTGLSFEAGIPSDLKKLVSIEMYKGFPHFIFDYNSQIQMTGKIEIPVTCTLVNPWDTVQFTYTITVKGIY